MTVIISFSSRLCSSLTPTIRSQSSIIHLRVIRSTHQLRFPRLRSFHLPPQATQTTPPPSTPNPAIHHHLPSAPIPNGPLELYHQRLRDRSLRFDRFQIPIVDRLQSLFEALTLHHPPTSFPSKPSNWFRTLFGQSHQASLPPIPSDLPHGIYLYGSVGTGKSMLMDLFYDSLDHLPNRASLPSKRIHFHQFIVDVHKRNHHLQTQAIHQPHLAHPDILVTIAREISRDCKVLCFDEFQVTDIVDAMILKRLLEGLLAHGVVIVMTSNRHPDELYKNGIQRESFLPCIELIKNTYHVTDLNSGTDYRKQIELSTTTANDGTGVFMTPINEINRVEFRKKFDVLTDHEPVIENRKIKIWGSRELQVPMSTSQVAWFSFESLCSRPLSAADYLEIVHHFKYVFLDQVPRLSVSQRDLARRFILFIDAAYESKTKLYTLSEVPIGEIFSNDLQDESPGKNHPAISAEMRSAMDDLGLDLKTTKSNPIFTGEEEIFAWARAVSRLNEMGSNRWNRFKALNNHHSSLPSASISSQTNSNQVGPKGPDHPQAHLTTLVGATRLGTSELVQDVVDRTGGDGSELLNHH